MTRYDRDHVRQHACYKAGYTSREALIERLQALGRTASSRVGID
jgi:hypothetical protein